MKQSNRNDALPTNQVESPNGIAVVCLEFETFANQVRYAKEKVD